MKSKKEMAKQKSAKAPVAALDVSAYFSEEEWKLLHEWQKELYRNVMKEIHQALISLGPLIATSVCSLRAKENEDVFAVDLRDYERRQQTNCSTSVPPLNSDNDFRAEGEWDVSSEDDHSSEGGENSIVPNSCHEASIQILSFSIKEEPDAYPMVNQDSQKKQNINYATEFPLPRPEDSPKGGGSILNHSSTEDAVIPPVVSFSIKNEGDAYSVNHQNSERNESISNSVCDPGIKSVLSVNVIHNEETHFTNEQYPEGKTTGISTSVNPTEQQQANSWEKMYTTSEYVNSVSHTLDVANNHIIYPEENAHACTEYGSGFNPSKNIGVHQRTDTRLRPYTWNECVKNDPSTLSPHEKIHTGLKLCTCSQCGKYFSQTANEITYPQMNNIELLNTCTECKKNFSHSENLNIEMRGRLYVCSECGKGFRQSQSLTNHLRLHTGEKPYSCRECGKSFRQSQTLTTHQRIHTGEKPYICCECGKCFSDMANLIRHRRIHTGERPYQCPVCDKRFNRHGHLIRHKRSHTVAIRK